MIIQTETTHQREFITTTPGVFPHQRGSMEVEPTHTAAAPMNVAPGQQSSAEQATEGNVGRPRRMTLCEKREVMQMVGEGLSIRRAAAHAGYSHVTVLNEMKRCPRFAKAMRLFRQYAETDPLKVIRQQARKSWRAAAFLLAHLEMQRKADADLEAEFDQITIEQAPHAPLLPWEEDVPAGNDANTEV
jgi:hypothetical protein